MACSTDMQMGFTGSTMSGGVLIVHQIHEGKHHYEVGNVMKHKKGPGKNIFVSKGDKLTEINGEKLQDLTPEELAEKIGEGNPLLTVHKKQRKTPTYEDSQENDDTLTPYTKETTTMSFSWEMTKDDSDEIEDEGAESPRSQEEDVCQDDTEENNNMEAQDLLVVHLRRTTIALVAGRGCDNGGPCQECHGIGCAFNDIIVVAESSTVTVVPQQEVNFIQRKEADVCIKNVPTHHYLRVICSEKTIYASPNPERITIYYYKSNELDKTFRGMPVVLNITGSNCFVRCSQKDNKVFLEIETREKQMLKHISKKDECAFSFVFYMKADRTKQRRFESALYKGWFIHVTNPDVVEMEQMNGECEDSSLLFVIQK